jgi:site-specific DNA-methyltransferase (adenine-specific)
MSRINSGLYSSADQTWCTPPDLIQKLLAFEEMDHFHLDAACSDFNVPATFYYRKDGLHSRKMQINDKCGLTGDWELTAPFDSSLVWLNPPYGKALQLFIKKAYEESLKGCRVWALIPARTETVYQHDYGLTQAGFTVFLKGRLHFLQDGEDKGAAPFPTMLLYYGDDWKEKAERWVKNPPLKGTLMTRMEAAS